MFPNVPEIAALKRSVRLTDGFGLFTAAVGGKRTAARLNKDSTAASTHAGDVEVLDPLTLSARLATTPVGKAPPFVWTPGQYESVEDSELRTTSILSPEALGGKKRGGG